VGVSQPAIAAGDHDRAGAGMPEPPHVAFYSLVSGAAATVAGAAASLSASGPARIAVWLVVGTAVAAASGLARHSAAVCACWAGVRRARPWSGS
jgi:hypothetical protein